MKIVLRPHHIIGLAGYIVEVRTSFRNLIVVNHEDEPIKLEVPVLNDEWIEEHEALGLEVIPVNDDDDFLVMYQMAKHKLDEERNNVRAEVALISTDDSSVKVYVIPTDEEVMIARDTYKLAS